MLSLCVLVLCSRPPGVTVDSTTYIPRRLLKKIGYKLAKDEESGEWEAVAREGADQVGCCTWVTAMWVYEGLWGQLLRLSRNQANPELSLGRCCVAAACAGATASSGAL